MGKTWFWVGVAALLIGNTGCRSWCNRWCDNDRPNYAPVSYAPQQQCVPIYPPAPQCVPVHSSPVPSAGASWQRCP